jgi:hypothetical protein
VVVFYFSLGLVMRMRLLKVILRSREWFSGYRPKDASDPAHRVVQHHPCRLFAGTQVHGAGVTVALPGLALHAAAARH